MAARALKDLRVLVTNDDGIHAPGIRALEKIARELSDDVWVVAPETEQSGASHSLTLTEPLRLREVSEQRWAVRGTPTDCVMLGVHEIIKGRAPDLLLSGVNRGGNLAEDVTYSGTIAAAMEGALLGLPSIALSQVFAPGHPVKWATAEQHAPDLIRRLLAGSWRTDVLINVNFPDVVQSAVKEARLTTQGRRDFSGMTFEQRIDARGIPYYWLGFRRHVGEPAAPSDLAAVRDGAISVTPLKLDLTDRAALNALRSAFD